MVANGGGVMYPPDFVEEPDDGDEQRDNRATVRRYIDGAWNQGDLSVIDTLVAVNYRRHHGNLISHGREQLKGLINHTRQSFPDLVIDVEDLIAENDKVVARFTLTGTDTGGVTVTEDGTGGDPLSASATGTQVRIEGIDIFRLAGGVIVESWHSTDALGLVHQLGYIVTKADAGA